VVAALRECPQIPLRHVEVNGIDDGGTSLAGHVVPTNRNYEFEIGAAMTKSSLDHPILHLLRPTSSWQGDCNLSRASLRRLGRSRRACFARSIAE